MQKDTTILRHINTLGTCGMYDLLVSMRKDRSESKTWEDLHSAIMRLVAQELVTVVSKTRVRITSKGQEFLRLHYRHNLFGRRRRHEIAQRS